MNPIPDIVVIDFCDWLLKKSRYRNDIILDINHSETLEFYAKQFIQHRKKEESNCPLITVFYQFLSSKEFKHVTNLCKGDCDIKHSKEFDPSDTWDYCIHCSFRLEIENEFMRFVKHTDYMKNNSKIYDISYYDLAAYMRYLLCNDNEINRFPQLLHLMLKSDVEVAEEINFLEWLQLHSKDPTDIRKMPSIVFERLVDEYISSNSKGKKEKRQLMKAYRQTGWEALLQKFQALLKAGKTKRPKDLKSIIDRYFSHNARFNCIILPLSNNKSQEEYKALITDNWNDLNALSADYLDIYYSEADNGKSGYDIAKRITALPNSLRIQAPCLVIWEHSISEAKAVPTNELTCEQILSVIRCIVEMIHQDEDLEAIVKEANKLVKDYQVMNHGAKIVNIEGHGNIVGDNNRANTSVTIGDNNRTNIYDTQVDTQDLVSEFDKAIEEVKASTELDNEQKATMCEIMEDAKNATIENSAEKSQKAKTAFNHIKSFIVKSAPTLISVLANLTKIASFFGLQVNV